MEILGFILSGEAAFFIAYLLGCIISMPLMGKTKLPEIAQFFIKLAIGFAGIPVIYGLFFTNGYSIFSGILLLYAAIVFLRRKEVNFSINSSIFKGSRFLVIGSIVLPVFLLIQLIRNGYFDRELAYFSFIDVGIYSTVAEYLKIVGVEVSSPWYQLFDLSADKTAKMYHYEDLWHLAHVMDLSGSPPLSVYVYIYTPVLALLNFFGNMAIIVSLDENWKRKKMLVPLGFSAVLFTMEIGGLRWSDSFDVNMIQFPKIASLPILLALGFVARRYSLRHLDCFAFGYIIIADVLFMPTILAAFSLVYALEWWIKRNSEPIINLILLVAATGFVFLFYSLFGSMATSSVTSVPQGEQGWLYYFAKDFAAAQVKHFIFLFPVYLTVTFLIKQRKNMRGFALEFMFSLLLVLLSSSFFTALMNENPEGFQFYVLVHTIVSAFMILGCIVLLLMVNEEKKSRVLMRRACLTLLVLQLIYGVAATTFWQQKRDSAVKKLFLAQVEKELPGLNKIGVAIPNAANFNSFNYDPRICQYCNFLKQAGDGFWINQIAIPASLDSVPFPERKQAVELSPFYRFLQKLKKEGNYSTHDEAYVQFIMQYEIDFVVVEKGAAIPPRIATCIKKILQDPYSGTLLILLENSCKSSGFAPSDSLYPSKFHH